jgi:23S rRNA (uridine2552-2'-O)-methyltransferase
VDNSDQPRSMYLVELAVDIAAQVLKPGGDALINTFSRDLSPGYYVVVKGRRRDLDLAPPEPPA